MTGITGIEAAIEVRERLPSCTNPLTLEVTAGCEIAYFELPLNF